MFPFKTPLLLLALLLPLGSHSTPLSSQLSFGLDANEVEIQNAILSAPCKQAEPIMPKGYNVSKVLSEKKRIVEWLSGAVSCFTHPAFSGPISEHIWYR